MTDEWIEVPADAEPKRPAVAAKRRDLRRNVEPGEWVTLRGNYPRSWPDMYRRFEFEANPGAIIQRAPWYVHAFGQRVGLQDVEVPILGRTIDLMQIRHWRYV